MSKSSRSHLRSTLRSPCLDFGWSSGGQSAATSDFQVTSCNLTSLTLYAKASYDALAVLLEVSAGSP